MKMFLKGTYFLEGFDEINCCDAKNRKPDFTQIKFLNNNKDIYSLDMKNEDAIKLIDSISKSLSYFGSKGHSCVVFNVSNFLSNKDESKLCCVSEKDFGDVK